MKAANVIPLCEGCREELARERARGPRRWWGDDMMEPVVVHDHFCDCPVNRSRAHHYPGYRHAHPIGERPWSYTCGPGE